MKKKTKIEYCGPFAQPTGYARAMHDYCKALIQADADLTITPMFDCDTDNLEPLYQDLVPYAQKTPEDITHLIVHAMPMHAHKYVTGDYVPAAGVKKICMTTWETSRLPDAAVENLSMHFDHIIVPSFPCEWAFRDSHLGDHLSVVPHCFDPKFWMPDKPLTLKPYGDHERYQFYTVSNWGSRKNLKGLLTAYLSTFTASDDVGLYILTPKFPEQAFEQLKQATNLNPEKLPPVHVCTERLSHEELYRFHKRHHCYVTASRGEAWDLPCFEACLVGNPTIAPEGSGQNHYRQGYFENEPFRHHVEYLTGYTPAVPTDEIDTIPVRIGGQSIQIQTKNRVAATGIDASQHWLEPDLQSLGSWMKQMAFMNYDLDFSRLNYLREHFSYEVVGPKLLAVLEGV